MSFTGGAVIYVICWWMVFFITLPFGLRTDPHPGPGHVASAPVRPRLWRKAAIATLAAGVLTALIGALIASDWLPLRPVA